MNSIASVSPPNANTLAANHSSVGLIRTSLVKFAGLLAGVFLLTSGLLVYVAQDLDSTEADEGIFYTQKAVSSVESAASLTVKDYAFWGDAYRYLHHTVDIDWAFTRQNLGPTLYSDFGLNGVFVVDGKNRTVYSVIDGDLKTVDMADWLGQPIDAIIEQARAAAEEEKPVSTFISVRGVLTVIAAAAITPGTDPTVEPEEGPASVMVFINVLDAAQLKAIGAAYGIKDLRQVATGDAVTSAMLPIGENGAAGDLHWEPERPGKEMLEYMLPLMGGAALLVCLMTWRLLRRTRLAAQALYDSYASLEVSQVALADSELRFRDVVEACSDWIWEVDAHYRFTYLSERFEDVTGLSRDTWIGANVDDLLRSDVGALSESLNIPQRGNTVTVQCHYLDQNGQARIARISARHMAGEGFRGTASDITEEIEARRRIDYLSQHDALTGLPNRARLQEFLDGKLRAAPTHERPLVMLCLDLDRFKPVNDLLGHAAGDLVLNEVSTRLSECVRSGDLVARVGGDEFVLIVTDISSADEVETLCRRLISSIEQPIVINEQEVFVSASIGVAMSPDDASQANELLRYADIALYEAKAAGRSTWRFYAVDMNVRIIERRRLESDLRYAIRHDELRLHFQPRFDLTDGRMVGAEALVRWQHPERGLVPPDTFIPIAEETGLIVELSNWVLNRACSDAHQWPNDLFISVNLSSIEFQQDHLVERIRRTLAETGLNPSRLELELTESVMLDDAQNALEVMRELKSLGVRLAMDDFGTGYSSLSYLRTFPFDGLKIDRSFVNRLGENEDDNAVIQAIVGLGRALSLTVTAEGIETAEQLQLLKSVRCDEGQGYLLSRPLDADGFRALIGTV